MSTSTSTMGGSNSNPSHWIVTREAGGICQLIIDRYGAGANTLSSAVMDELDELLDQIVSSPDISGVVITSGKASGFIAGADVTEFESVTDADHGEALATRGQQILAKLESLRVPTVAAIDGYALGGGLELALACTYRIAAESYERQIGLPEVRLGIHPGFGGTVRLVRTIGAPLALDLMVTGRQLSPIEAQSVGLVDHVVAKSQLITACRDVLLKRPPPTRAAWWLRPMNVSFVRRRVANSVRGKLAGRVRREHYPAPYAIIELWERFGAEGRDAYLAEAKSIGALITTNTARNLLRVFLLRERLRSLAPKAGQFTHVHVVGAGVMGGDIAAWCAYKGFEVSLQDKASNAIDASLTRAANLFHKRLHGPGAAAAAENRLRRDPDGREVTEADIAIEAVVEKLDVKQSVFQALEAELADSAILASNTSSLRIESMADRLKHSDRFLGLHFFNPVEKMPLVEVISGAQTTDEAVQRALSFVTQIGKLPVPCKSSPGFIVNRILTPYMLEALYALDDGHAMETIDAAAEVFGMPVGPIELADQVGLDVAMHVANILSDTISARASPRLAEMVDENRLGRKTSAGFYDYVEGKPQKKLPQEAPDSRLQDRLLLPLINEAVACVAEQVVADDGLLDAAAVFGTGFAPFRGGPICYARQRGIDDVIATLESLSAEFGQRFKPHNGWQRLRSES